MALVKVVSANLFTGANLQKLEVGATVEVEDELAQRWKVAGLVEVIDSGERKLEVATTGNDSDEQPAKSRKAK